MFRLVFLCIIIQILLHIARKVKVYYRVSDSV